MYIATVIIRAVGSDRADGAGVAFAGCERGAARTGARSDPSRQALSTTSSRVDMGDGTRDFGNSAAFRGPAYWLRGRNWGGNWDGRRNWDRRHVSNDNWRWRQGRHGGTAGTGTTAAVCAWDSGSAYRWATMLAATTISP